MRVDLRTLEPNPFRDLRIDPIEDDLDVRESIKRHEFWGGTVIRAINGKLQIAAGHVRVHEAKNCGITHADLFVSDKITDEDMVRIYATENATQRGVENNAVAGSVVATIRMILMRKFDAEFFNENNSLDEEEENSDDTDGNSRDFTRISKRGPRFTIGQDAILKELKDIPGYTENMIRQQISLLKFSGDYDRIVSDIITKARKDNTARIAQLEELRKQQNEEVERKKIEKELADKVAEAEAIKKADRATKIAANKRIDEFGVSDPLDLIGISKHLQTPSHINTFRELALGEGNRHLLPKEAQAPLAEQLVKKALEENTELTQAFIRAHFYSMITSVRSTSREYERTFAVRDWESNMHLQMREFSRHCRGMIVAGTTLSELDKKRPKGTTLHATIEFTNAIANVRTIIKRLEEEKVI